MQIVIEYVLIQNFIINYFILSCSAKMFKVRARLWWLSALFGAIMALFFPIFNFPVYVQILAMVLVCIIMVSISFPIKKLKDAFYYGLGFTFLTFVFGGATTLVTMWFGSLSTLVITLVALIMDISLKIMLRHIARRRAINSFTCSVQICCKGRVVEENGYIDSANMLYDPITKSPIVLISRQVFKKVVGEDYLFFLANATKIKKLPYGHTISANGAVSGGKMIVFMADKITITEKGHVREYSNTFLGLSTADFSRTLGSGVLVHSTLA